MRQGVRGNSVGFGDFLKEIRSVRYRSAREFCLREGLAISYPQYSRYESGEQLPSLETAILIGLKLGVDARVVLRSWCLAQVAASSAPEMDRVREALLTALPSADVAATRAAKPLSERVSLDDVIVFNRAHLRLFESDLRYRDIFTYVNAFALGDEGIPEREIAQTLGIGEVDLGAMLARLDELGVVHRLETGHVRAAKKNFYFPDDAEFFALRNQNVAHNLQKVLENARPEDLLERRAYRALVTRELTEEQFGELMDALEALLARMVGFSEDARATRVYSLCVALGKRFERSKVGSDVGVEDGSTPGLATQVSPDVATEASKELGKDGKSA